MVAAAGGRTCLQPKDAVGLRGGRAPGGRQQPQELIRPVPRRRGNPRAAAKGLPRQDRQRRQHRLRRALQVEDIVRRLEPRQSAAVDAQAAVLALDADAQPPQDVHRPRRPGGHAADAAGSLGDGRHPQGLDRAVALAGHADLAPQARRPGNGAHHQGRLAR